MRDWYVDEVDAGTRVDRFVTDHLQGEASRTQIQNWLKDGAIEVNGRSVKANSKLAAGDWVVFRAPEVEELDVPAEEMPLDIYYEDPHLIVINKPRGMVVHPAPGHNRGTLVNGLLAHCKDLSGINGVLRPGIVHRIDKDTSGLLMAAKDDEAHRGLAEQLQAHTVERLYLGIVQGVVPHEKGTIDAPIGRDPHDRQAMTVTERNSKHAVTHFEVLERLAGFTFIRFKLETGRTHQIRVHMKYIGYPLVGDPRYGAARSRSLLDGQALHAQVLGFKHPRTGEQLRFEASLPGDLEQLLDTLRKQ